MFTFFVATLEIGLVHVATKSERLKMKSHKRSNPNDIVLFCIVLYSSFGMSLSILGGQGGFRTAHD